VQSQTLTGREYEPKERQRKNKLGHLLLHIPPPKKKIPPVLSVPSSTVRYTQYSSFYFFFQALFSNILVMPLARRALVLQCDVVLYARDSFTLKKAYTFGYKNIMRININIIS
jgi:hypothetical protein